MKGLRDVSTLIEDVGAEQTGTAMMSLYQTIVGGVMKQPAAQLFSELGLVKPGGMEFTRAGIAKKIKPGGNMLADLVQEDPMQAADLILQRLKERKGVKYEAGGDASELRKYLGVMFGNRNANSIIDTFITQRPQIEKESRRAEQSKGVMDISRQLEGSDLLKIKEYEAALTNFRAQAGLPMIKAGTEIASALMPVAKFFGDHPAVTEYAGKVFLVTKGFAALAETGSLLSRSGVGGWFSRSRGEADKLREVIADVSGTKTTRFNVDSTGAAKGFGRVKGMLSAIPSELKIGVQFLVAGAAIDQILKWKAEYDERNKTFAQNSQDSGRMYDEYVGGGKLYGGKSGTKADWDVLAGKTIETISQGKTLEMALNPKSAGLFENFWTGQRPYASRWSTKAGGAGFDPETAAGRWRKSDVSKAWADPNVLASVLRQIDTNPNYSGEGAGKLREAIKLTVGPDIFGKASEIAALEVAALGQQTQQNTKLFGDLFNATERMPSSFLRFGSSLDILSLRMGGVTVNQPWPGGGPPGEPLFPLPPKPGLNSNNGSRPPTFFGLPINPPPGVNRPRGGAQISTLNVNLNMPDGVKDPQTLARIVATSVATEVARVVNGDFIMDTVSHDLEIGMERV